MKLPLLISVPHAGLRVPDSLRDNCLLSDEEIRDDGDGGAAEAYAFAGEVESWFTTDVARAVVDLNRAEDDRRKDGVVKTHTCWDVPIWRQPLTTDVIEDILARHHRPYHAHLREAANGRRFGVDCHTMAATGPPVGPDAGAERPAACLSDADGSCPRPALLLLKKHLDATLERSVSINDPFGGGWIIRSHARELPWVQLELSRASYLSWDEKRDRVLEALRRWCAEGCGL